MNEEARRAAQAKSARDYEAPKDIPDTRSAEQIEEDLARVREEMTATVNELAARFTPDRLKEDAKNSAKQSFANAKDRTKNLAGDAMLGDKQALAILGSAGVLALLVLRKIFKR